MRQIFPDEQLSQEIFSKDDNRATKDDINQLTVRIDETIQALGNLAENLATYKEQMAESINTDQITAINGAIEVLQATEADLGNVSIENAEITVKAVIEELEGSLATLDELVAETGRITSLISNSATLSAATIGTLTATTAHISNWVLQNISAQSIITNSATLGSAVIGTLRTDGDASILGDGTIAGDLQVGNDIQGKNITVEGASTQELAVENIYWKGKTTLTDVESVILGVPHFENGQYFIQLRNTTGPVATIEIFNSVDNYFARWSQPSLGVITNIYKDGTDENAVLYIEIENPTEDALDLYYASTCKTENVPGPASYTELPVEPLVVYPITYKDGSKFFKNVDLAQQGSTVGTLRQLATDDITAATDDVSYDTTEDVVIEVYKPDQSLNTDDSVEFGSVTTQFLGVRDFRTRNFVATELQTLNTIDLTEFDDGALVVVRVGSTSASNQPSAAYIKQTVDNTPVLFDLAKCENMPTNVRTNKPIVWNPVTKSLVEATDVNVDGDLEVTGDAYISGDLTVAGTVHSIDQEVIVSVGDMITLRANNNLALATGQVSGLIINKYNGVSDLTIATDSDGTLRVGTAAGTDTSYTKIALNHTDGKYYTYDDIATPTTYTLLNPQPSGTMTSWTGKTEVSGYTQYATAVFTVIDLTTLVPLLGRDEDSNLSQDGILFYDKANWIAKTTAAPTQNNTALIAKIDAITGAVTYDWGQAGGGSVSRFDTLAEAQAALAIPEGQDGYIPDNGLVIVDEENGHIYADDDMYATFAISKPTNSGNYVTDAYLDDNGDMKHVASYIYNKVTNVVTFYDDSNTSLSATTWDNKPDLYVLRYWEDNTDIGAAVQFLGAANSNNCYFNIKDRYVYMSYNSGSSYKKAKSFVGITNGAEVTFTDNTYRTIAYANIGTSVLFDVRGE